MMQEAKMMEETEMKKKKIGKKSIDLTSLVNVNEKPFVVINEDYQIVALNAAYENEYDILQKESIGKMCYQVIRGKDHPCKLDGDECPHHDIFQSPTDSQPVPMHYDAIHHSHKVSLTAFPLMGTDDELLLGKCVDVIQQNINNLNNAEQIVGESRSFKQCVDNLDIAARSDVPVLLNGDTGTGKELAAAYIHQHSSRSSSPFQIIDCTVLTEASFEVEMFGNAAGAFTGCVGDKLGLFELTDGGTIFFDKIGDLLLPLQAKLLRVLESGVFRRVGGVNMHSADVRIICATNKNLWEFVTEGNFREDLYHRIACLNVRIPALAERIDDIPVIAKSLLENINQAEHTAYNIRPDACEALKEYSYTGNIRELKNILFVATTQCSSNNIDSAVIKNVLKNVHSSEHDSIIEDQNKNQIPSIEQVIKHNSGSITLKNIEELRIKELLEKHDGSRKTVADELGISERTLYRKLIKLGINKPVE